MELYMVRDEDGEIVAISDNYADADVQANEINNEREREYDDNHVMVDDEPTTVELGEKMLTDEFIWVQRLLADGETVGLSSNDESAGYTRTHYAPVHKYWYLK